MSSVVTGTVLARGVAVNVVAILASNLRAIFTLIVARVLGKAVLGTFAVAYAIADWVSVVAVFGLDWGTTTLIARARASGDDARARRLLGRAVAWGLVSGIGVAGIVAVILPTTGRWLGLNPALTRATSLLMLAVPGMVLYKIGTGASRGMGVMAHDIYSRGLVGTFTTIAGLLVAMALGATALAPVIAVIAGSTAMGLTALVLAGRLFTTVGVSSSREPVSVPLLRFSAPIGLYGQLNTLISRLDMILLGVSVGGAGGVTLEQVGIYGAAAEVAGGLRKIRQTFDPIAAPVVAGQAAAGNTAAAQETFARLARWVLAAQLLFVGVLCLAGGIILPVFGPGFAQGALWLAILALAHGTGSFAGLSETVIMVQRPALNLLTAAVTLGIQFVCCLALISGLGATGAALGMLLAYLVQAVLRYLQVRVRLGWTWPWRALARPAAAGVAAFVPALVVRLLFPGWAGQLVAAAVFIGGYLAAWKVMGLDASDAEIISELWKRREQRRAPVQ